MEEARYWMWAKTKPELSPRVGSYGDSWEEQAFAEDAAGALGGCVWPPRSYSCSFCRRDFRSAQALGGHMNVHRRDRARLKQSPNPTASEVVPHALSPCTSAPLCSFLFTNPNPNPNPSNFPDSPLAGVIRVRVSSPPPPRLSVVEEKEKEKKTFRLFAPPNVERGGKAPSWSSFLSGKRDRGEEEVASCKRRRVDEEEEERKKPSLGFVQKMIGVERCLPQAGGAGDELDLELRLGDAPKVK